MAQMTPMACMGTLLVLLAMACSVPRHAHPGDGQEVHRISAPGVLHISATYQAAYCGGADPGLDHPRPHPWQGSMYLRRAKPDNTGNFADNDIHAPILDSIRTNALGQGYLALPPGTYLLLDRDRVDDRRYHQLLRDNSKPTLHTHPIDTTCLRQWLHGPSGVLNIAAGDTTHVVLPFMDRCPWEATPCVTYFGPYPP